ncbi:MAG: serine hydrolase [Acidobacteria bacterium]|nr:serine hydrolase [Acidobacteriota bacterium]
MLLLLFLGLNVGLEQDLSALIANQSIVYGLAYEDLQTHERILINADHVFHAASTMKVPVMLEVFRRVDAGTLTLDQKIPVDNHFKSVIDGSEFVLEPEDEDPAFAYLGQEVSILDLVKPMITHSSNLATNVLILFLGPKAISDFMDQVGATHMEVRRALFDNKAFDANLNNESDAASFLAAMVATTREDLFSKSSRDQMFEILCQQHYRDMIPAGLPSDFKGRIGNKTGSISRVQHDGAIVQFPDGRRYALVVYTGDFGEDRARAIQTAVEISRTVYQNFTQQP